VVEKSLNNRTFWLKFFKHTVHLSQQRDCFQPLQPHFNNRGVAGQVWLLSTAATALFNLQPLAIEKNTTDTILNVERKAAEVKSSLNSVVL